MRATLSVLSHVSKQWNKRMKEEEHYQNAKRKAKLFWSTQSAGYHKMKLH
jgi:hypothetical protein